MKICKKCQEQDSLALNECPFCKVRSVEERISALSREVQVLHAILGEHGITVIESKGGWVWTRLEES